MITSVYPVLFSADVSAAAEFYRRTLGFTTTFEADWYVSMVREGWELAVLDRSHPTVPEAARGRVGGAILNIEVDDVDAEYRHLVVDGDASLVLDLRTETFGQRHFIIAGPDGVLVDVITPTDPAAEYFDLFTGA